MTFKLERAPQGSGSGPLDFGYTIQSCDTLTWSYGDGTSQSVIGSNTVTHDYPLPGNYPVAVTIANSLGSVAALGSGLVIADAPSRMRVLPSTPSTTCDCIVAMENSGSVSVQVERTLDLSRTASVDLLSENGDASNAVPQFTATLTFAPGETLQTYTVPIHDDSSSMTAHLPPQVGEPGRRRADGRRQRSNPHQR